MVGQWSGNWTDILVGTDGSSKSWLGPVLADTLTRLESCLYIITVLG